VLYVDAPGETFVKAFEVDIASVSEGVLITCFPLHYPFYDGFGWIMTAKTGTVKEGLAADAEINQLQDQNDDQRLTGYEQDLFHA
jgi:hypothetical protein